MIKVPLLRHQRYVSPLQLTSRVRNQQKTYQKKCWLWHLRWTYYGQFYWTKLSECHIHTKYCKFDHSEMIFGPFEKLTFYGELKCYYNTNTKRRIDLGGSAFSKDSLAHIFQFERDSFRVTVHFEDKTIPPAAVKLENLRIVFEVPDEMPGDVLPKKGIWNQ